jgi:hypothetical protein
MSRNTSRVVSKSLLDILCNKYVENNLLQKALPAEDADRILESKPTKYVEPVPIFKTIVATPSQAKPEPVKMSKETINDLELVRLAQKQLMMNTKKRTNRN